MCGDAQRNHDFYTGALGLRLVKATVNFDDPGTYHLYYGTERGAPGTLLTFFPWEGAPAGRGGAGTVGVVALGVPPGSLPGWRAGLAAGGVAWRDAETPFGEPALALADPDGLRLVLIEEPPLGEPWRKGGVPEDLAIRRICGVELWVADHRPSERLLSDAMGAVEEIGSDDRRRFRVGTAFVDLVERPGMPRQRSGRGVVHHVAFGVRDDETQTAIAALPGIAASPVHDRCYFRSVYFREPGGALFEIATDGPGFATDEDVSKLGERLCLPPWLEGRREAIRAALPPLVTRSGGRLP